MLLGTGRQVKFSWSPSSQEKVLSLQGSKRDQRCSKSAVRFSTTLWGIRWFRLVPQSVKLYISQSANLSLDVEATSALYLIQVRERLRKIARWPTATTVNLMLKKTLGTYTGLPQLIIYMSAAQQARVKSKKDNQTICGILSDDVI